MNALEQAIEQAVSKAINAAIPQITTRTAAKVKQLFEQETLPPWLTAKQAAVILKCSPKTLTEKARRGKIDAKLMRYEGNRLYLHKDYLEK